MKDRDGLGKILPREIVRAAGIGGLALSFWLAKTVVDYQDYINEEAHRIYASTYPFVEEELPQSIKLDPKLLSMINYALENSKQNRIWEIRRNLGEPDSLTQILLVFSWSSLLSVSLVTTAKPFLMLSAIKNKGSLKTPKPSFLTAAKLLRLEWEDNPPTEEEMGKLKTAISFLPPVGGKVMTEDAIKTGKTHPTPLSPTLTAEEQVAYLIQNQRKLGEHYIYQMTVQGLLPDRFKFAALALILTNPHQNDWSKDMFGAPWGKVSPLVHDGGNVQTDFSSQWHGVSGRTDFLMRMVTTFHPDLEQVDVDSRDDLQRAQMEIMERGHLLLQAKGYQRLALALHCFLGSSPAHISEDKRRTLASYWGYFQEQMERLISAVGVSRVAEIPWFADVLLANRIGSGRYEADWPPVRRHLLHLEEVRWQHPEMIRETARLLVHVTDLIDREIGLIPQ